MNLSGYFSIANTQFFVRCLSRADFAFVQALDLYASQVGLSAIVDLAALDFGHLKTFYSSRYKVAAPRHFNDLEMLATALPARLGLRAMEGAAIANDQVLGPIRRYAGLAALTFILLSLTIGQGLLAAAIAVSAAAWLMTFVSIYGARSYVQMLDELAGPMRDSSPECANHSNSSAGICSFCSRRVGLCL